MVEQARALEADREKMNRQMQDMRLNADKERGDLQSERDRFARERADYERNLRYV